MAKTFGNLGGRARTPNPPKSSSRPPSATPSRNSSLGASVYASTVLSLDADEPTEEIQPLNDQQWVKRH